MAIPVPCQRCWALFTLLLFCAGMPPAIAGDPDFTYRTHAAEVRLNFSALDQNEHGVATLRSTDFAVVDKDVIVRNFKSFTRSDWTKLEIAILIDTSESVTPSFRHEMSDALQLISQTAGVPDQNLSIFTFEGSKPRLLCAEDCRVAHAAERLPTEGTHGLTPLFDTVAFAANFLAKHGDAHAERVLIVFSDGADTISQSSLANAIDAALRGEVQLDCIDLNQSADGSQGATVLRHLARATGGRYFPPPAGASQALNATLEGYRASYSVSYELPSHASGFHTIRILPTHNLNLQFRSRSGYYYPDQTR